MQVNIFTLCDSAQEYDGKLIIVGTFNHISAAKFPVIHREFALVARITFSKEECGRHDIELSINKRGGDTVILQPNHIVADTSKAQEENATVNVIIKGINITIPEPGIYTIRLKIDDKTWESELNVIEKE